MKTIKKAIKEGKFEIAEQQCQHFMMEQVMNDLEEQAFKTGDICFYVFVDYLAKKQNSAYLHFVASNMLLNYYYESLLLDNVVHLALYHAQKATELNPYQIDYKEHFLSIKQIE